MIRNVFHKLNLVSTFVTGILILIVSNAVLKCDAIDGGILSKAANKILTFDQKFAAIVPTALKDGKQDL